MLLVSLCLVALLLNLLLQLGAIAGGLHFTRRLWNRDTPGLYDEIRMLGLLVTFLFLGHLLQIAVWAGLFRGFGQFDDFATAFYHSTVNYSSLGYGDLVMQDPWRLAGALEASAGVMMFGVSTATLFAAMSRMLRGHFGREERGS